MAINECFQNGNLHLSVVKFDITRTHGRMVTTGTGIRLKNWIRIFGHITLHGVL